MQYSTLRQNRDVIGTYIYCLFIPIFKNLSSAICRANQYYNIQPIAAPIVNSIVHTSKMKQSHTACACVVLTF